MQRPISGHTDALRMRAQGKASDAIAAELGKARSTVIEALRGTPGRRQPTAMRGPSARGR